MTKAGQYLCAYFTVTVCRDIWHMNRTLGLWIGTFVVYITIFLKSYPIRNRHFWGVLKCLSVKITRATFVRVLKLYYYYNS